MTVNHGEYKCPNCGEQGFTELQQAPKVIICDSCGSKFRAKEPRTPHTAKKASNREIEWSRQQSMGRLAYDEGKPETANPNGKGLQDLRGAWDSGWHQRRREVECNLVT